MTATDVTQFLLVAAGGAIGAMLRFAVQNNGIIQTDKFWLTAIVNLTGCLTIGVAYAIFQQFSVGKNTSLLIVTGMLGGYTTFSTFAFDSFSIIRNGRPLQAAAYLSISVIGGVIACACGYLATLKILNRLF